MEGVFAFAVTMLFSGSFLYAQNEKYVLRMRTSIDELNQIDKAKPDLKLLQNIADRFEVIAAAEPKQWLSGYYAAYCYVIIAFHSKDMEEKDQYLDKAEADLKAAQQIAGNPTDEILVLKAYIALGRLATDPVNRWQQYGPEFSENLAAAKVLNADNPRIYYLEGANILYTPDEYGGGKTAAKPVLQKALEKFSIFKPESVISPGWGKMEADWMLSQTN
jgi:hypothetical protein